MEESNLVYKKLQFAFVGGALGITALVLIVFLLRYLSGILLPLAFVYVFSIVLRRPYRKVRQWLEGRFGNKPFLAFSIVFVASVTIPIVALTVLGSLAKDHVVQNASKAKGDFSGVLSAIGDSPIVKSISKHLFGDDEQGLGILLDPKFLSAVWEKIFTVVGATSGATFSGIMAIITWVIIPSLMYSLVTKPFNGKTISYFFPFLEIRSQKFIATISERYNAKMERYFTLQTIQVFLQVVIIFVLFSLFQVEGALAIALVVGILNLVPNLGTLVLFLSSFIVGLFNYAEGMLLSMLAVLVVSAIILILDNLVLPDLLEKHSQSIVGWEKVSEIDRTVMAVSIIFWGYVLDGILGLILAVPITIMMVTTLRSLEISKKWQDRSLN